MKGAGFLTHAAAGLLLAAAPAALGQSRPFLFTVTPSSEGAPQRWTVHYDAGYAERTTAPVSYDGMEQRIGVQGALGRGFTLIGQAGLGLGNGSASRTTEEVELLKDVTGRERGLRLAVGLGLRREWEGASVALGRVTLGRHFAASSLFGNLRFERAFSEGRDGVDFILTTGWLRRVGPGVHLGVEAVGEDLEGLWEAEEAEGGAKVFVGPSLRVAPAGRPWALTLGGGPILYASRSTPTSTAPRPLGGPGDNGYTVRLSLGYTF
ncbi:MAG TPA: hypothetical protein VF310_01690 [Vicinamibacteria bacterium]